MSLSPTGLMTGLVQEELPVPITSGTVNDSPGRMNRYAEFMQVPVMSAAEGLAEEGSVFVATNPTPGTALQYGIITAYSATAAVAIYGFNGNSVASRKRVRLDHWSLMLNNTAPTATTVLHLVTRVQNGAGTPTAGSPVTITPVNPNMGSTRTSGLTLQAFTGGAAITVPAADASARIVSRMCIPTSLGVTGDNYVFYFGKDAPLATGNALTAVRATAPARITTGGPPVIIDPQQSFVFIMWWLTAATNGPYFEWELMYHER